MMPCPGSAATCSASHGSRSAGPGMRIVWREATAGPVRPEDRETRPQNGVQVVEDAIVGRRGGAQEPEVRARPGSCVRSGGNGGGNGSPSEMQCASSITSSAMHPAIGPRSRPELLVRQPLGRDQEDVHLLRAIAASTASHSARFSEWMVFVHAHPLGRDDLVAHQGEQGRDQSDGPRPGSRRSLVAMK